jgi:peptidyl-prolyl cis-trans isomerase A (cyclophilin A)
VNAIAQGDVMETVEIIRVGKDAEDFNAIESFRIFEGARAIREAAAKKEQEDLLKQLAEGFEKTKSGLRYQIIQKGTGKAPKKGDIVVVHYTGMLPGGKVFDSSIKRKAPIDFPVGKGHVIAGWDEGIMLLQKGTKARFVIPPQLAYGAAGAGGVIPPDATLIFDVELVDVK